MMKFFERLMGIVMNNKLVFISSFTYIVLQILHYTRSEKLFCIRGKLKTNYTVFKDFNLEYEILNNIAYS